MSVAQITKPFLNRLARAVTSCRGVREAFGSPWYVYHAMTHPRTLPLVRLFCLFFYVPCWFHSCIDCRSSPFCLTSTPTTRALASIRTGLYCCHSLRVCALPGFVQTLVVFISSVSAKTLNLYVSICSEQPYFSTMLTKSTLCCRCLPSRCWIWFGIQRGLFLTRGYTS